MSVQVENLEKNMAKLTIEVAAEKVEDAIQAAYMKEKGKISVPGFRKGKVPRKMIEKMYGAGVFYEDAANAMINEYYPKEAVASELEIASQPVIDVIEQRGHRFQTNNRHCSDRIRKTFHLHSRSCCKTGSKTWQIQRRTGNKDRYNSI